MEPKDRRKIQFSMPMIPSNLDPRAVEMIRRRRPTPATLFRVSDTSSPEEETSPRQRSPSSDNGLPRPRRAATTAYKPPSIKAVQHIVQSQLRAEGQGKRSADDAGPNTADDSSLSDSSDSDSWISSPLDTEEEPLTLTQYPDKSPDTQLRTELVHAGSGQQQEVVQHVSQEESMFIQPQPSVEFKRSCSQPERLTSEDRDGQPQTEAISRRT
uniref:Protein phosphatase 1 regulatory subunit 1B n=1 Tax=Callorhinchus milii TaxID=7868 RepID=V9L763_CALMI